MTTSAPAPHGPREIVELTGHVLDTGLFTLVLDDVRALGGDYEVVRFDVGKDAGDTSTVRLASQYAAEHKDKVVIAKVDATANDVPDEIQGFPTIKLYPAGDKENPVTYQGARTVEDFIEFIQENGKHKAGISAKEEMDEAAPAATEEAAEEKDEL